jgi:hypothetical protein
MILGSAGQRRRRRSHRKGGLAEPFGGRRRRGGLVEPFGGRIRRRRHHKRR